jgi:hypothetical protein
MRMICARAVGQWKLDLPVQTSGTEKGGIQDIDSVCGSKNLDTVIGRETIQLVQKLQHSSLHLPVSRLFRVETLCTNCIQLVDEDD